MAFTGTFVYIAHHFIFLPLTPFDLSLYREGWWFEHSLSKFRMLEGAKKVSWSWLSSLRG